VIAVPESVSQKSRVAAELALGLAASGHPRILLLEGDLQRPWVQRLMRIEVPISGGFSQQMNARSHRVEAGTPWTVVGCSKSLHVLAEGMMRSPGLLLSKQFQECLRALRTYYDIIIIDGPSTALAIDAAALNAVIDGLVTVCPAAGSANLAPTHALFDKMRFSALVTVP
jgi:Mrp family chromosome partitioning ATPase